MVITMKLEEVLSELIQIRSVNPPGDELKVAEYLKGLFDQAQIENEIIQSCPGRGNFLAWIGEGRRKLLFLSHTDVVPAQAGWDFDPFSGRMRDGFVHGRGALDCKSLVAAQAWAMIWLAEKSKLRGRLVFAATADEERGGAYGLGHLIENFRGRIAADFAVTQGGEGPITIEGKPTYLIQVGEKGTAWAKLKSKGLSCHGSIPTLGQNAVLKMARAIEALSRYKPRVFLIPEVRQLIQALAELKGLDIEASELNLDQLFDQFSDKKTFAEQLRALTRLTLSPNVIHGGIKTNIVPDSCEAEVDIRVLPGQDEGYVRGELHKILGDLVEIEIPQYMPPNFSDAKSPYYKLVEDSLSEVVGDIACLPYVSPGATDSRYLRKIGVQSYGVSPMAPSFDPALARTVHGKNERVDIESLYVMSKFLTQLAKSYLGCKGE